MYDNGDSIKLVYKNIYEYDITSCYYSLLKSINFPLEGINKLDKIERNKYIGNLKKNNLYVNAFLEQKTKELIDLYIKENNLKPSDIISRNKDGFISTKKLNKINLSIPLSFRAFIVKLIFSTDMRRSVLFYETGEIKTKGFVSKPYNPKLLYKCFSSINYKNKKNIINSIEDIRTSFHNTDNKELYSIIKDNEILIPIKKIGMIKVNKSYINSINNSEIDKSFIWNEFYFPFLNSIIIQYVRTKD